MALDVAFSAFGAYTISYLIIDYWTTNQKLYNKRMIKRLNDDCPEQPMGAKGYERFGPSSFAHNIQGLL